MQFYIPFLSSASPPSSIKILLKIVLRTSMLFYLGPSDSSIIKGICPRKPEARRENSNVHMYMAMCTYICVYACMYVWGRGLGQGTGKGTNGSLSLGGVRTPIDGRQRGSTGPSIGL